MDPKARIAEKMAALASMGFERVDLPGIATESVRVSRNRYKVTCTQPSMGTLVSVTSVHESEGLVQEASAQAFQEMDRVVNLLNRHDPSSALSYLNTERFMEGPPPELSTVLLQARFFHNATDGAFDPTVQPLVDLFRDGSPDESEVLEALALVGARSVEVSPRAIRLPRPGMGVTLDGIAKGFVVDRIAVVLREQGLKDFLINAGGDIRSGGFREDGEAWRVGVQDPQKRGDLPDVIGLIDGAVATSGSYEIYFDPGRTYHHIVSARTGNSPQSSQSVSVIAPTTLAADALATSLFVMEPERGVAFIESLPQCACLIIDQHGRQLRSKGWRSATDPPTPKAGIT
jgi:thiamine biosynthesis lipoprotein